MLVDVLPRGIFDIIPMVCWVTFFFCHIFFGAIRKKLVWKIFQWQAVGFRDGTGLKKRHALEYHSILLEWEPLARIFFFFCGGGGVCLLALSPSNPHMIQLSGGDVRQALKGTMLENYQATNAAFTALRVDGSCVAWGHPQSGGILGQELLEVHGLDQNTAGGGWFNVGSFNFCWAKSFDEELPDFGVMIH